MKQDLAVVTNNLFFYNHFVTQTMDGPVLHNAEKDEERFLFWQFRCSCCFFKRLINMFRSSLRMEPLKKEDRE